MSKTEVKTGTPVTVNAKRDESTNYFVMKLPQKDKSDPNAKTPTETGGIYLSKEKYPEWATAKGAKVTIEPIY